MIENPNVGLLGPKILYSDYSVQKSVRIIPNPIQLIFNRINDVFNLNNISLPEDREINAPFLLGCFLIAKTETLLAVNGFDKRFFLYMEDLDLCRKISSHTEVKYFPNAYIFHRYEKGSRKKIKLFYYHIISAIKYFNKWGWIFDNKRKKLNKKLIDEL